MALQSLYKVVRPKILLVNFEAVDEELLLGRGYNVERGFVNGDSHHFPSPGYEYDIVIARFDRKGYDDARKVADHGTTSNEDADKLSDLISGAGFALIFTGSLEQKSLRELGMNRPQLTTLDARDTSYVVVEESPQTHLPGYNFTVRLLTQQRENIVLPVAVGLTWKNNDEDNPVYGLAANAATIPIAAVGYKRVRSEYDKEVHKWKYNHNLQYVILPEVKGGYARITADYLAQLPRLKPDLFPGDENYRWMENEAYTSEEVKRQEGILNSIREDFEARQSAQETAYKQAHEADQWMRQLLIADDSNEFTEGEKLTDAVLKAFSVLGFEVEDGDKTLKGGKRREDLRCMDGEYSALIECKGTISQNPEEGYVSKLQNHLIAKKHDTGILVVNHDRKQDAFSRGLPYEDSPHILDYELTIVPTVELYKLLRAVERGEVSKEDARSYLKAKGRFEYTKPVPPPSEGATSAGVLISEPL